MQWWSALDVKLHWVGLWEGIGGSWREMHHKWEKLIDYWAILPLNIETLFLFWLFQEIPKQCSQIQINSYKKMHRLYSLTSLSSCLICYFNINYTVFYYCFIVLILKKNKSCLKWSQFYGVFQKAPLPQIILLLPKQGYYKHEDKWCWKCWGKTDTYWWRDLVN